MSAHYRIVSKKRLYPISEKGKYMILPNDELTSEEYMENFTALIKTLEAIKKDYYSNNASVRRIQSRRISDLIKIAFSNLNTNDSNQTTILLKRSRKV